MEKRQYWNTDKRRAHVEDFEDSTIFGTIEGVKNALMVREQKASLMSLFPANWQTRLVYKSGPTGFIDEHDPLLLFRHAQQPKAIRGTVVLMKTDHGKVFGCYSNQVWLSHNSNDHHEEQVPFLFTRKANGDFQRIDYIESF